MASIYYGKLSIVAVTTTDTQAGYPGSNLSTESLGRPWYAADAGAKTVVIDLGASKAIDSLFTHDVNFASAPVSWSTDNVTYSAPATLTTYSGRHGRRRGRVSVGATMRYLKIAIAGGTPSDGLAYWRVGAAYVFSSKVSPAAQGNYPSKVTTYRPRVSTTLANHIAAVATTGNNIDVIEFSVPRFNAESADDFIQRAAAGSIVLDLEEPNYPEQQWPVRLLVDNIAETFDSTLHSSMPLSFQEIV